MKTSSIVSLIGLASSAAALPFAAVSNSSSPDIDVTVLQFALTLEHLENVFYKGGLDRFSAADFTKAGFNGSYYENLRYIAEDEQSHVELLEGALKAVNQTPVAASTYNFPYYDVHGFVSLASVLEGVGTSAYLGGASLITNKAYLNVAASILVAEAVHTSLQRSALGEIASANPNGTPLDPTSVYTLAASFIVNSPKTNAKLPFTPFPALYVSHPLTGNNGTAPGSHKGPAAHSQVSFSTSASTPSQSWLTFVSGLSVVSVQGQEKSGVVTGTVPAQAQGQTYVFITKANVTGKFEESAIVAGPVVLEVAPPAVDIKDSVL